MLPTYRESSTVGTRAPVLGTVRIMCFVFMTAEPSPSMIGVGAPVSAITPRLPQRVRPQILRTPAAGEGRLAGAGGCPPRQKAPPSLPLGISAPVPPAPGPFIKLSPRPVLPRLVLLMCQLANLLVEIGKPMRQVLRLRP